MWLGHCEPFLTRFRLTRLQARQRQCTAEHLTARSSGGTDGDNNIVAACVTCNLTRHRYRDPPDPESYRKHVRKRVFTPSLATVQRRFEACAQHIGRVAETRRAKLVANDCFRPLARRPLLAGSRPRREIRGSGSQSLNLSQWASSVLPHLRTFGPLRDFPAQPQLRRSTPCIAAAGFVRHLGPLV